MNVIWIYIYVLALFAYFKICLQSSYKQYRLLCGAQCFSVYISSCDYVGKIITWFYLQSCIRQSLWSCPFGRICFLSYSCPLSPCFAFFLLLRSYLPWLLKPHMILISIVFSQSVLSVCCNLSQVLVVILRSTLLTVHYYNPLLENMFAVLLCHVDFCFNFFFFFFLHYDYVIMGQKSINISLWLFFQWNL